VKGVEENNAITLLNILPSAQTAAAVSSQEDSMARMVGIC
jgi:hypothetical protein